LSDGFFIFSNLKNKLLIFFLLCQFLTFSQEKFTLSGTITNSKTGETVVGAKIFVKELQKGTLTNTYGYYSLTLPKGTHLVEFKSYETDSIVKSIDLQENLVLNIELNSRTKELNEVQINGKQGDNIKSTKIGQIELDIQQIKTLPAFMGEVDIIKMIQLLPGVSSVNEG